MAKAYDEIYMCFFEDGIPRAEVRLASFFYFFWGSLVGPWVP